MQKETEREKKERERERERERRSSPYTETKTQKVCFNFLEIKMYTHVICSYLFIMYVAIYDVCMFSYEIVLI